MDNRRNWISSLTVILIGLVVISIKVMTSGGKEAATAFFIVSLLIILLGNALIWLLLFTTDKDKDAPFVPDAKPPPRVMLIPDDIDKIENVYSFEDLALALANCAYYKIQQLERRVAPLPPLKNVDNMCASYFDAGTHILMHLKILKPIDDLPRRSVFTCKPSEFEKVIEENKPGKCSYGQMVQALILFLEHTADKDIFDMLAPLGFCARDPNFPEGSVDSIVWSDLRKKYNDAGYPSFSAEAKLLFKDDTT